MNKIMFNTKYGLEQAVLEERKTQTRRVITLNLYNRIDWKAFEEGDYFCLITDDPWDDYDIRDQGQYRVGDVVAIAQSYKEVVGNRAWLVSTDDGHSLHRNASMNDAGWNNKMFVQAQYMPHHIKITDIKVERLQDISDEDCLKEGICKAYHSGVGRWYYLMTENNVYFSAPREAFAALIDKTSGKGTWDKNPYVFVYDFVLID